jgi:hypothetical protein
MRPSGWCEVVRFAAMALDKDEPEEALAALRNYAASEREHWATYSSAPWQPPEFDAELLALRRVFPAFDPTVALRGTRR